jgi:hypothetical protein
MGKKRKPVGEQNQSKKLESQQRKNTAQNKPNLSNSVKAKSPTNNNKQDTFPYFKYLSIGIILIAVFFFAWYQINKIEKKEVREMLTQVQFKASDMKAEMERLLNSTQDLLKV